MKPGQQKTPPTDIAETHPIGDLIRAAGRREDPPQENYNRVLAATEQAFHALVQRRRRRRISYGLAASLLTAAILVAAVIGTRQQPTPIQVAVTETLRGTAAIRATGQSGWTSLPGNDSPLMSASQLRTGRGSRIGILLTNGVSVRLDELTEIELESGSRIHLMAGTVYVDSGRHRFTIQPIQIVTQQGKASDIGTQFELQYIDDVLRLRVREGRVLLQREADQISSAQGDQLSIDSGGQIVWAQIASDDPEWSWVETVAPAPDIDGEPVTVLLDWVGRETGRKIKFDNPDVKIAADRTILHGDVQDLSPMEALVTMLSTTDLEFSLDEPGTIVVSTRN